MYVCAVNFMILFRFVLAYLMITSLTHDVDVYVYNDNGKIKGVAVE